MSPLTDRDTNVQATSSPFQTSQGTVREGEKMQQENAQQHKQVLEQKKAEGKGYVGYPRWSNCHNRRGSLPMRGM